MTTTNPSRLGVALIPEPLLLDRLIAFQHDHQDVLGLPKLGRKFCVPHLTLYQGNLFESDLDEWKLRILLGASNRSELASRLWSLSHQPADWLFVNCDVPAAVCTLQHRVIRLVSPLSRPDRGTTEDTTGFTPDEQESQWQYGYRYVGPAFRPHFTIGTRSDPHLPEELRRAFESTLLDAPVHFNQLTFYRCGERGSLASVIASTPIP